MSKSAVAFAAAFTAEVAAAARAAIEAGAAVLMIDGSVTSDFRQHPAAALDLVSAELDRLTTAQTDVTTVVCCYSGSVHHGLDADELAAVLGRRLHFTTVNAMSADNSKRSMVIGTLRKERLSVGVVLDEGVADEDVLRLLDGAARPGPIPFLSADRVRRAASTSALGLALSRFCSAGNSVGLWVREDARAAALADPQSQIAPWRTFAGGAPLMVRFERPDTLRAQEMDAFMRATGIRLDVSMPIDGGAAPPEVIVRTAAYTGAAPYRPQPFDLRVPWFRCDSSMWLELPPRQSSSGDVANWWADRTGPPDAVLAMMLDANRREAFDRRARVLPDEERHYPEFRIYNWPATPPAVRASLLMAPAGDVAAALELVDEVAAFAAKTGPSVQLVGATTLHQTAIAEVIDRFDTTAERAIRVQGDAHRYLRHIPYDAPLRQDYAAFARFVPAALGRTLEIGSGYGVLAWTLAPRAEQYLCIDLDLQMFGGLRRDLGQRGLIADMQHLPLTDGCIDAIVANNVIEHLYDPLAGLIEIRRVLGKDGRVFALLPLDALNSRHELPAHHWKIDAAGITPAFAAAGYDVVRIEIVDLYALGVRGSFPSCNGLVAMVEARRAGSTPLIQAEPTRTAYGKREEVSGHLLPAVRERVRFERLHGRRVAALDPAAEDAEEFVHYGAELIRVGATPWALDDRSVDLVYAFLTLNRGVAAPAMAEVRRVLAPGGRVVMVFRNRDGLQYQAGVRSYYGAACDLASLGLDTLAALAAGAGQDDDFVTRSWLADIGQGFRTSATLATGLAVDDLRGWSDPEYPAEFWRWLSGTAGRFLVFSADR